MVDWCCSEHSIAKSGSLPACLALIRALLIVWICLSIKPFDFGNFGDDVVEKRKISYFVLARNLIQH